MSSARKRIFFKFIVFVTPILIGVYYIVMTTDFGGKIAAVDTWSISNTENVDANINWQLKVPCLRAVASNPNNMIAFTNNTVAVLRNCLWHTQEIAAIDINSGNIARKIRVYPDVQRLESSGSTYYALMGNRIITWDETGQKRTFSEEFVSRSVRDFFVSAERLYVPFRTAEQTGTYVYQIPTGDRTTEPLYDIVDVTNNRIITRNRDRMILRDTDFNHVATIPIEQSFGEVEAATLTESTLIVFEQNFGIAAYDVNTSALLWEVALDTQTFPVVDSGSIYVIEHNALKMYRIDDGQLYGQIRLENPSGTAIGTAMLAARGQNIFVGFINQEILLSIAIE